MWRSGITNTSHLAQHSLQVNPVQTAVACGLRGNKIWTQSWGGASCAEILISLWDMLVLMNVTLAYGKAS